jgi:hypothetical protein
MGYRKGFLPIEEMRHIQYAKAIARVVVTLCWRIVVALVVRVRVVVDMPMMVYVAVLKPYLVHAQQRNGRNNEQRSHALDNMFDCIGH